MTRAHILAALRAGPMTVDAIARSLNADAEGLSARLYDMHCRGLVERTEQDGWRSRGLKRRRWQWRLA